jgi:hypothetical protein
MARINIKLPREYFEKDRDNRLEARLAKFELKAGDTIRFQEWDPETDTLTGRYFDKKVINLHKIHKATRYWSEADLHKHGIYVMELEN